MKPALLAGNSGTLPAAVANPLFDDATSSLLQELMGMPAVEVEVEVEVAEGMPAEQALAQVRSGDDSMRGLLINNAGTKPTTTASTAIATSYSHAAMVDLMVSRPDFTHAQLCSHFGRPQSWLASVLASEAFQLCLDARRHEVLDPSLTASLQERFKALAIRTSNVLLEKLDNKEVDTFLLLRASEISIKAIGMGQKQVEAPEAKPAVHSVDTLAERLLAMMDKNSGNQVVDIEDAEVKHGDY